ncbi:MAG: hypothetical protein WAZ34_07970 [Rhodocyclaceae bacterium]
MNAASAQTRRTIVAAIIGNGLIVYDFTIYSFSAVIIGQIFFPSGSTLASLQALRHFPEAAEYRAEQGSEPRFSGPGRGD